MLDLMLLAHHFLKLLLFSPIIFLFIVQTGKISIDRSKFSDSFLHLHSATESTQWFFIMIIVVFSFKFYLVPLCPFYFFIDTFSSTLVRFFAMPYSQIFIMASLKPLSNNPNIYIILSAMSVAFSNVCYLWFCAYWVILDYILDILNNMLWNSGSS